MSNPSLAVLRFPTYLDLLTWHIQDPARAGGPPYPSLWVSIYFTSRWYAYVRVAECPSLLGLWESHFLLSISRPSCAKGGLVTS